jgi:hypothetical protein
LLVGRRIEECVRHGERASGGAYGAGEVVDQDHVIFQHAAHGRHRLPAGRWGRILPQHILAEGERKSDAHVARGAGKARLNEERAAAGAGNRGSPLAILAQVAAGGGQWFEDARHVETLAAFFEESAGGVPQIVVSGRGARELHLLAVSINALEFAESRDDIKRKIDRAVAGRSNKARRRRAHSFDRFRSVGDFFNVYARR